MGQGDQLRLPGRTGRGVQSSNATGAAGLHRRRGFLQSVVAQARALYRDRRSGLKQLLLQRRRERWIDAEVGRFSKQRPEHRFDRGETRWLADGNDATLLPTARAQAFGDGFAALEQLGIADRAIALDDGSRCAIALRHFAKPLAYRRLRIARIEGAKPGSGANRCLPRGWSGSEALRTS